MHEGQLHIYTGNGKGKTTAALGLAIRAVGAGKRVLWTQFVKGKEYHEIAVLKGLKEKVVFRNYGRDCFINRNPEPEDYQAARTGLTDLQERYSDHPVYDIIVIDELTIALYFQLISLEEVIRLIEMRPAQSELIITGRYAPAELIQKADLVTEMKEIRHYYQSKNLLAREGIEC